MESRFATPSDGVTIRYAIGRTPRASGEKQVHVDEEDKTSYLIQVSGSNYKASTTFINESG